MERLDLVKLVKCLFAVIEVPGTMKESAKKELSMTYEPGDCRYESAYKRLRKLTRKYNVTEVSKLGGCPINSRTFNALYRLNKRDKRIGEKGIMLIEKCLDTAELLK